ncbi:hypothetical protein BZM27_37000 [Paraburkholderia steynii]|uniref:ChrR-like cupin domain-containing protein n=1 Tax=Paraburkholderia steynii TaxID=1245441 RepID=A0A4R0X7W6_9BURK|nr:hypothetical protein BZM27_37000 [Paraburkholderia steynii]
MHLDQPKFFCVDSEGTPWVKSRLAAGVEVKNLGKANGRAVQLVRFAPSTVFPEHLHSGPEFIYILSGSAVQNGCCLTPGWVGIAERGTVDRAFRSDTGCVFLLIYESRQFTESLVAESDPSRADN